MCLFWAVCGLGAQNVVKDTLEVGKAVAYTPANLLQGQMSGVRVSSIDGNPNGAINVNIRGLNTVHGDSQPLWIIDGAVLSTSLNSNLDAFWQYGEESYSAPLNNLGFLSAYEIESIEVLKDLSATALYGDRGANGVIIVKTKLPTKGERNILWRSNVGIDVVDRPAKPGNPGTLGTVMDAYAMGVTDPFKMGIFHNHTLGVSGFAAQTAYNVSGFFRTLDGIAPGIGNTVGGMAINFETKANSVIWFGLNTFLSYGHLSNTAGTSYFGHPSVMMLARYPSFFPGDTPEGWEADYDDDSEDYRSVSSMYMQVNFTPAFYLKATMGVDFQNNNRRIWYGNGTAFGAASNGAAGFLSSTMFNYNGDVTLYYSRFFGSDHQLNLDLGVEAVGNIDKFNIMNGLDFFSHDLRAMGLSLMGSKARPRRFAQNYTQEGARFHFTYKYKDIAGLDGLVRADVTRRYDDWNPMIFPGVNAWFDLGKVAIPENPIVSSLKLTAGYGAAGREYYVPYERFGEYLRGDYPIIPNEGTPFFEGLNRLRSTEFNIGAEAGLLDGRILLAAKYYDKKTEDKFFMYRFGKLDDITGNNTGWWYWVPRETMFTRDSGIDNRGLEFDLSARIIDSKEMAWTVFANATVNVNQISKIEPVDARGKDIGSNMYVNANIRGYQVGALYGYDLDDTGAFVDYVPDGRITEVDKKVLGNAMPKFYGAFGTTFRYGRATLDLLCNAATGFSIANLNRLHAAGANFDSDNDGVLDAYELTPNFVERADYFRISRLGVSYDIPFTIGALKGVKVSATALNLLTCSKYSGWNPDVNCFGVSTLSNGVDYGAYPAVRTFVLGVSANF